MLVLTKPLGTQIAVNAHQWLEDVSILQYKFLHASLHYHSGPPPVCQDLSTCHECPVKKAIANLPVRLKGISCGNNYQTCVELFLESLCWRPRTRILAPLYIHYELGLDYVCLRRRLESHEHHFVVVYYSLKQPPFQSNKNIINQPYFQSIDVILLASSKYGKSQLVMKN